MRAVRAQRRAAAGGSRDSPGPRSTAAQEAGLTENQLRQVAADALSEVYFRDNGRRAHGPARAWS
jgi:hypothetical protein